MGVASKSLGPGRAGANGGKSRGSGHGPNIVADCRNVPLSNETVA